jgi:hypothetical protein
MTRNAFLTSLLRIGRDAFHRVPIFLPIRCSMFDVRCSMFDVSAFRFSPFAPCPVRYSPGIRGWRRRILTSPLPQTRLSFQTTIAPWRAHHRTAFCTFPLLSNGIGCFPPTFNPQPPRPPKHRRCDIFVESQAKKFPKPRPALRLVLP